MPANLAFWGHVSLKKQSLFHRNEKILDMLCIGFKCKIFPLSSTGLPVGYCIEKPKTVNNSLKEFEDQMSSSNSGVTLQVKEWHIHSLMKTTCQCHR